MEGVGNKKLFSKTIIQKLFDANSSFLVKKHTTEKVQSVFFRSFFLVQ